MGSGNKAITIFLAVAMLALVMACSPQVQPIIISPVEQSPVEQPSPSPLPSLPQRTEEPAQIVDKQDTLRALANNLGKDWGTAIMPLGMNNALYLKTLSQHFNVIIPDYGMYMTNIQPQQGVWDFRDADSIVNYGIANKLKVRGHTLVWGGKGTPGKDWTPTPAWVHNGKFTKEDMIKIMYDHMTAVINRYGNKIQEWVVVNESASWERSGGFADNIWKATIGEDYVELAFRKVKELAPSAVLILNEFGGDYIMQTGYGREENIYNHIKKLVQRGIPIDAVGLEFHLTVPTEQWEFDPTLEKILANIERYAKLGLKVYVTELDIKIKEPVTKEKLDTQDKLYAMVMEAVLKSDACKSISVWGYSDAYSWITTFNTFPGYTDGCMFDKAINPKPAYDSIMAVLKRYIK